MKNHVVAFLINLQSEFLPKLCTNKSIYTIESLDYPQSYTEYNKNSLYFTVPAHLTSRPF